MRRADAKARTRQDILEAAQRAFATDGFAAASMRTIAKDAGCAVGTLFVHFDDKYALLHAILADDIDATIARALTSAPPAHDAERSLHTLVGAFFQLWRSRPGLYRALLRHALLAQGSPAAERFRAQVEQVFDHITTLYAHSVATGELREGTDPHIAALSCLSFYYFTLMCWLQDALPPSSTMEGVFAAMLAQQFHGLRGGLT
ncbi:MAG: TetR/AcrR family transcriptional regulator [Myxococcota bacterium]